MTCDIIHKNFSKKKTQKTATVICSWRCYKKLALNISDIIVESNENNVLSNVLSYQGHFSQKYNCLEHGSTAFSTRQTQER